MLLLGMIKFRKKMTKDVEIYFLEGCGRCPLGGTPDCKIHKWKPELEYLRTIILNCGLVETSKWGTPCYMFGKSNVLLLSALKDCATIGFFKGVLLVDTYGLLQKQGENSNVGRVLRITSVNQIVEIENQIKDLIVQAVEIEKQGIKVETKKTQNPISHELQVAFEKSPELKKAFYQLTPGRQRGYLIYFNQPKQVETKIARIKKCQENILKGIGLHDKYKIC
jgi:uncharacterized protein YdeI (YjbR/CyaY-like superfamily)